MTTRNQAYEAGRYWASRDHPIRCPYKRKSLITAWQEGFRDQSADRERIAALCSPADIKSDPRLPPECKEEQHNLVDDS